MTTTTPLIDSLKALPGVTEASAWTKIPGKERIYLTLSNHNGSASWARGKNGVVIHLTDGRIEVGEWSGAKTRDHHDEIGTVEAITAIVEAR